jgi:hypothetical protein
MMITRTEQLKDTLFNQRYGQEILKKSLTTERSLKKQELDWITSNPDWTVFTITVTFKNLVPLETGQGMKLATKYEYNKKVVTKIKKRLCRLSNYWNEVLPVTDFYVYEYDQTSFFKKVSNNQSPHHIHGILPIPNRVLHKFYNLETGELDKRLMKDLKSLSKVSTFLIEPLRLDEKESWFNYMLKDKTPSEFN